MKVSIAEYAAKVLPPEFQMPLMSIEGACAKVGWEFEDRPKCCGSEVTVADFIGEAYQALCNTCGRFVFSVTAPRFGNSWVNVLDSEKVDLETDYEIRWIAGTKHPAHEGGSR